MRIDLRHQRREPEVARADDADLAVRFRRVLHQPVDGVVGIRGFIDARVVQRPDDRTVQHPLALGTMQPADVLVDADVVVFDELGVHHFEDVDAALAGGAMRGAMRVVRRARQQDRRVRRALLHHEDGVELDAVAHGNHRGAADEVRRGERLLVLVDDVGRHRRDASRCLGGREGRRDGNDESEEFLHGRQGIKTLAACSGASGTAGDAPNALQIIELKMVARDGHIRRERICTCAACPQGKGHGRPESINRRHADLQFVTTTESGLNVPGANGLPGTSVSAPVLPSNLRIQTPAGHGT